MAELKTIESQLFRIRDFDEREDGDMTFYGCVLNVDIGPFVPGEVIPIVEMNYSKSEMVCFNSNEEETYRTTLRLSVGDPA